MRYESLKNFHSCLLHMWQDVQDGMVSIDDIKPCKYANIHGVGVFRKSFVVDALKSQEEPTRETSDAIRLQIAEHKSVMRFQRELLICLLEDRFASEVFYRAAYNILQMADVAYIEKELAEAFNNYLIFKLKIAEFNKHGILKYERFCRIFLRRTTTAEDVIKHLKANGYFHHVGFTKTKINTAIKNLKNEAFLKAVTDCLKEVKAKNIMTEVCRLYLNKEFGYKL